MKHVGIVKKWLNGAVVQYESGKDRWIDLPLAKDVDRMPTFLDACNYRVKPEKVCRVLFQSGSLFLVSAGYYKDQKDFETCMQKRGVTKPRFMQMLESTAKVK